MSTNIQRLLTDHPWHGQWRPGPSHATNTYSPSSSSQRKLVSGRMGQHRLSGGGMTRERSRTYLQTQLFDHLRPVMGRTLFADRTMGMAQQMMRGVVLPVVLLLIMRVCDVRASL